MARINVEDSIYKDARFFELTLKLNGLDPALGALVRAWALAQKWWITEFKTIPMDEWKKQKMNDLLIETGLAQVIGDRIRMRGSEDQFAWLNQKIEAGRKGGLAKASNAKRPLELAKRNLPSYSSSFSNSKKIKEEYSVGQVSSKPAVDIQNFIGIYVKAFQKRYPGARPSLTGKVQGQIKTFLKDHDFARACDLIQIYFQMEDKWFETKTFDFTTFMENLQKVSLALDTGQQIKPKTESEKWLEKKLAEETKLKELAR